MQLSKLSGTYKGWDHLLIYEQLLIALSEECFDQLATGPEVSDGGVSSCLFMVLRE